MGWAEQGQEERRMWRRLGQDKDWLKGQMMWTGGITTIHLYPIPLPSFDPLRGFTISKIISFLLMKSSIHNFFAALQSHQLTGLVHYKWIMDCCSFGVSVYMSKCVSLPITMHTYANFKKHVEVCMFSSYAKSGKQIKTKCKHVSLYIMYLQLTYVLCGCHHFVKICMYKIILYICLCSI